METENKFLKIKYSEKKKKGTYLQCAAGQSDISKIEILDMKDNIFEINNPVR